MAEGADLKSTEGVVECRCPGAQVVHTLRPSVGVASTCQAQRSLSLGVLAVFCSCGHL